MKNEKNKSQINELTSFLSEKLVPLKDNIFLKYSSYKISEDKKEKEQKQNSLKMFFDEDIQNNLLNLQAYEKDLDDMINRNWKEDEYFDLKKIYNHLRNSIYSLSEGNQKKYMFAI